VSEPNAVFDLLGGFRAAAYRLQLWLAALGLAALAAAAALLWVRLAGAWTLAVGGALLALSVLWARLWRRRVERRFWLRARRPARGSPVRLPLSPAPLALLALALAGISGGAANGADTNRITRLAEGKGLDLVSLLDAAGTGGLIAAALGVLALLLALYLFFSLWIGNFAPRALHAALLEKLGFGDRDGARRLCEGQDSLLARAAASALAPSGAPGARRSAALMEAAGRREAARWRTLVGLLAAAGMIAPLAGVLGTVLGMIEIFSAVASPELSPALVAAGAVGALVPAAAGVASGLVALGAYYLTDLRLAALLAASEAACLEVGAALESAAAGSAEKGPTAAAVAAHRGPGAPQR